MAYKRSLVVVTLICIAQLQKELARLACDLPVKGIKLYIDDAPTISRCLNRSPAEITATVARARFKRN